MPRSVFLSCFQRRDNNVLSLKSKKNRSRKGSKTLKPFPRCYAVLDLSDCNAELPQMELQETSTKRNLSAKKKKKKKKKHQQQKKKQQFLPRNSKGVFCLLCLVPPLPAPVRPPPPLLRPLHPQPHNHSSFCAYVFLGFFVVFLFKFIFYVYQKHPFLYNCWKTLSAATE